MLFLDGHGLFLRLDIPDALSLCEATISILVRSP